MVRLKWVLLLTLLTLLLAACGRANVGVATPTSVIAPPTQPPTPEPNADLQATFVAASSQRGEELFNTNYSEAGFACVTCHNPDSEEAMTGPGMLGLGERAETRVDDLSAREYLRQSIVEPNAHLVDGFNAGVMPQVYGDLFSEQDLDDLVNYLLGL